MCTRNMILKLSGKKELLHNKFSNWKYVSPLSKLTSQISFPSQKLSSLGKKIVTPPADKHTHTVKSDKTFPFLSKGLEWDDSMMHIF